MVKNEVTECTAQKKSANNSRTQQRMLKWCGVRIASIGVIRGLLKMENMNTDIATWKNATM